MGQKQKSQVIEKVTITGIAAEGKCIARHENQVIFVEDVAPGDVVDLQVTMKKKKFMEGKPLRFHQYSKDRQAPFCIHYDMCGGCKWQHITYDLQLAYKRQQVIDNMERIAKVTLPEIQAIIPSAETRYYRNKLEFTFTNKKWLTKEEIASTDEALNKDALGFHIPRRFDKILDITHCHLQPEPSNSIRNALKAFAREKNLPFYDLVGQEGLMRNLIVRTANTGDVMAIVQFAYEDQEAIDMVMAFIHDRFPEVTSLQYIINSKGNDSFYDQDVICFAGEATITEAMEDLRFRVGPKSFYQTNAAQALVLYQVARDMAGLQGHETVYDLYTGTGTIANFVARTAKKVVGIEAIAAAIEDARVNATINTIENTLFFAGDMRDVLNMDFIKQHGQPDVIITDPPRAGMHVDVVQRLLEIGASRIVYISCNPATQARDIALLDAMYAVKAVQPVDMFPHTYHVENVVLLEKR